MSVRVTIAISIAALAFAVSVPANACTIGSQLIVLCSGNYNVAGANCQIRPPLSQVQAYDLVALRVVPAAQSAWYTPASNPSAVASYNLLDVTVDTHNQHVMLEVDPNQSARLEIRVYFCR